MPFTRGLGCLIFGLLVVACAAPVVGDAEASPTVDEVLILVGGSTVSVTWVSALQIGSAECRRLGARALSVADPSSARTKRLVISFRYRAGRCVRLNVDYFDSLGRRFTSATGPCPGTGPASGET